MKEHVHTYDTEGNITCCSLEEKIDTNTPPALAYPVEVHHEGDGHDHDHSHDGEMDWHSYLPAIISFVLLLAGLAVSNFMKVHWFNGWIKLVWYLAAYIPVAWPVIKEAWGALRKGEIFTEFFLMSIATIGAFAIGEYPEGVAVMLFYAVGELFQKAAVQRAKSNIKALLDVRPNSATVFRNGVFINAEPEAVAIGERIQVKVGEKIPLDGKLLSQKASVNIAALTGESKPESLTKNEQVLAGSINLEGVIEVEVEKKFNDSSISRIFELVQNATSRKSETELLIRKLAKRYTPIVVYLAITICFLPYLIVDNYVFSEWLYRALVFLVISCPCALVISIPLGYFGGLGAASKNGLLFKGATYLDQLTKVNTLVMDKTGTLTKGVFKIQDIELQEGQTEAEFMLLLMAMESKSTHPIAKAIMEYQLESKLPEAIDIQEIAGKGLIGRVGGKEVLVGNKKLMQQFGVEVPSDTENIVESIVMVIIDRTFAGYVTIADELKSDAHESVALLRKAGIQSITMLSGDKDSITQKVAIELQLDSAKGGLLPEDKLNEVERIQRDPAKVVAFVGDGINDAPVLATADIGIAMGGLGSDVAIETADIIIQTDQPSKIATAIQIGRSTQQIIWQNIWLVFIVKALVLIGGAFGFATMWQAVFADVGVALLAILNAVRLQGMKWES